MVCCPAQFNVSFSAASHSTFLISTTIDHFTVVCLVPWPLYESEAGVDLVLIKTSLPFFCKLLLISMRTASST